MMQVLKMCGCTAARTVIAGLDPAIQRNVRRVPACMDAGNGAGQGTGMWPVNSREAA